MMKTMNKLFFFLFSLLLSLPALAQESGVEMAEALRSNGKIYVVVAVMAIIFLGVSLYLFLLDRRVGKLEKQNKNNLS